jgi:hypothetical protein
MVVMPVDGICAQLPTNINNTNEHRIAEARVNRRVRVKPVAVA